MMPWAEVVEVEERGCLGVAREAGLGELGELFMRAVPEVDAALREGGAELDDDLVAHYRPLEDGRFALWIGRPSDATTAPRGLQRFALPAGRVVRAVHVGPYDELAAVTRSLLEWSEGQGLAPVGESWEVYHHLEQPAEPSTYRTTVCVRVEG